MGGWVTALTAAHDHRVIGAVLICAADMGALGARPREEVVAEMKTDMESLAGGTAEIFSDDVIAGAARWHFSNATPGLTRTPLLVLTSDDGLAPQGDSLVAAVRKLGNTHVTTMHAATDHSWSDARIALESAVLGWLAALPASSKQH